ncbi:MAG: 50S ribosomal protein L6 [Deltaproteobacteria bacterium]|jgi:large subunit ribosomal protein L6|nr:50S ribosomal protein L6 [Deltaproteobacteria bacterium]
MSRVGKKPIPVPDKAKIDYKDKVLTVKGDKGSLTREIHPAVDLEIADGVIHVTMLNESNENRALQGLTRSLVANMVTGVSTGFERVLEINGIGYRAELKGKSIVFNLGYSNPITFDLPEGVSATSEKNNIVKLSAIDKELLGRTAASIRQLRPPEPYKGKGIKYAEEYVQRKAGKTGTK